MRWPAGSSANSERSAAADRPRARSAAAAGVSADGAAAHGARSWPELPEHSERGRAAVRTSPAACGSRRISGLSRSFHRCRTVRAAANPHRRPRRMTPLSADERIGRRAESGSGFPGTRKRPHARGTRFRRTGHRTESGSSFPGTRKRPLARGPRFRRIGRRTESGSGFSRDTQTPSRTRTPFPANRAQGRTTQDAVLDRREPDISRAGAVRSPSSAWGDERSGMQVPNRKIIYNDSYV